MERLIRNVTKKYTNLLPEGQPFYTPGQLKNLDIPEFLFDRIDIEIRKRLNDTIAVPHSEWSAMDSEKVKNTWDEFLEALVEERRMPASYAAEIIETSVADIAGFILKPRTEIPSILFGTEAVLQKSQVRQRIRFITVNTHLAEAILKYMDRKKKKELDIETCRNIVEKVDERLTQNYSPQDWAKHLEPLYTLSGPKVDSELFRIFFDSRDMEEVAHRFDLLTDYLTRERFIEVMEGEGAHEEEDGQEQVAAMSEAAGYSAQAERNHSQKKSAAATTLFEQSDSDTGQKPEEGESQATTSQKSKIEEPHEGQGGQGKEDDEQEDTLLSSFQSNVRDYDFPPEDDDEEDSEADYFNYYGLQEDDDEEEEETAGPAKDDEPTLYSLFMEQDEGEMDDETEEEVDVQPWDYVDKTKEERTFSGSFFDDEDEEDDEIEEAEEVTDKEEGIAEKAGKAEPEKSEAEIQVDFEEGEKEVEVKAEKKVKKKKGKKEEEVYTSAEKKPLPDEAEPEIKAELPAEDDKPKDAETAPDYEMVEIKDDDESDDFKNETAAADDVDEAFLFGVDDEKEGGAEKKSDGPIWQAFLSDEDHIDEEDIENIDDAGFYAFNEHDDDDDDPIMSQLIEAEKKENVQKLIGWLKEDEKRFIRTIFNGSQNDYETALIRLDEFDSWKQAASFIGKEIFARNSVNMYDDDAVDFTDRLQQYFEKYKT